MRHLLVGMLCAAITAGAAEPEIWSCVGEHGRARDFLLWPDGGVVFASGDGAADARGLRGFWHGSPNARTVMLESGESAVIRFPRGSATIAEAGKGDPMAAKSAPARPAIRVTGPTARWLGVWIWRKPNDPGSRYVALLSDGGALAAPGTHGRWTPVPRGIRVEWHDGAIDLLQFDTEGAALRSWPRGVPTSSIRPAATRPQRAGSAGFEISP